jgi:hypothetical protein
MVAVVPELVVQRLRCSEGVWTLENPFGALSLPSTDRGFFDSGAIPVESARQTILCGFANHYYDRDFRS